MVYKLCQMQFKHWNRKLEYHGGLFSLFLKIQSDNYRENHIMGGVTCHSLRIDPIDPSQLYVTSVNGAVAHCSRHSAKTYPKAYVPDIGECY